MKRTPSVLLALLITTTLLIWNSSAGQARPDSGFEAGQTTERPRAVQRVEGAARLGKHKLRDPIVLEPILRDFDGDGLMNYQEIILGTDPWRLDTNGDGVDDYTELIVHGAIPPPDRHHRSPLPGDTDGDGLSDEEELEYGTDPNSRDTDGDFLSDAYEALDWGGFGTSPTDPDADRDGLLDGREVWWACDPHSGDTDSDSFVDKEEIDLPMFDPRKGDGIPYTLERLAGKDSDADGLPVGAERWEIGTNPVLKSTDGDRYSDGQELLGHDVYTGEDLPAYVEADPFVPATPDIVIEVDPTVKLLLSQSVKFGDKEFSESRYEYQTSHLKEEKDTIEAGIESSIESKIGFPPWSGGTSITLKTYANVRFQSTSTFAHKWDDKEISAEEAYSTQEVDLSGSKLEIWIRNQNVGNDILVSPLGEILLNIYMGGDSVPFHSTVLQNVFTNITPGEEITLSIEIPLTYEEYQRFMAGEGVEAVVGHYAFGDDQIYLENAKARSVRLGISGLGSVRRYFVPAPRDGLTLRQAFERAGVELNLADGGSYIESVDGVQVHFDAPPYKVWEMTCEIGGEVEPGAFDDSDLGDLELYAADSVLLRYVVDTDGDGLSDSEEMKLGTRADQQDTDGDRLTDGASFEELGLEGEMAYGTHPLLADTDFDGYDDKVEVEAGTDPLDPSSHPSGSGEDEDEEPCLDPCPPGQRCCEFLPPCRCPLCWPKTRPCP